MCTHARGWTAGWLAMLMVALSAASFAGVPKPGLVLYGKVIDGQGDQLFDGELVWTYTPDDGGPAVTVTTTLDTIEGPGGPFSYRVIVPLESEEPGFPADGTALPVGAASAGYLREGRLLNTDIVQSRQVSFSNADISSAKRVDLCITCTAEPRDFHSADLDRNHRFSLGEFLRVAELYVATPDHDYHVASNSEDGFAPGVGPRTGEPHSSDYYGGADWRLTVQELVRMIDLFASTPDHAYTPDGLAEDGFRKERADAPEGLPASRASAAEPETLVGARRYVRGGRPGHASELEITLEVEARNGGSVSALGLTEFLPDGWRYAGSSQSVFAGPAAGDTGYADFAWHPVPAFPYSFTYTVDWAATGDLAADLAAFQGELVYRTVSGNVEQTARVGDGLDGAPVTSDLDGDGLADDLDGFIDVDGDGVPNFIDVDSDNDGLTDREEIWMNGDGDYDPSSSGGDTDFTNPDSDGDGVNDGAEVLAGANPLDPNYTPNGVPVGAPWTLGLLVLLLSGSALLLLLSRPASRRV